MSKTIHLSTYAQAYIDCLEQGVEGGHEIRIAVHALRSIPELHTFLRERSVHRDDRIRAIQIALPSLHQETVHFIALLGEQGYLDQLADIEESIKLAYAKKEQRMLAYVTSAVQLENEDITRIATALNEKLGTPVLIEPIVDPNIIGGIRITIGDWVYDSTIEGRMKRLKQQLYV